jgi:hypothetical protein
VCKFAHPLSRFLRLTGMAHRESRLLRLRVDVLDQPIKMGLERFTALVRPVTPNVHRRWDHAEITRQLTF